MTMEKLLKAPHPFGACAVIGATIVLGAFLGFGMVPLPTWAAYCVGLVCGAALGSMGMIYLMLWAAAMSD